MRTLTRKLKSAVESRAQQVFWIWRCFSCRTSFPCALSPDSSPVVSYSSISINERSVVRGRARGDGMEWRGETLSPFRFPPSHRPSRFPWSLFSRSVLRVRSNQRRLGTSQGFACFRLQCREWCAEKNARFRATAPLPRSRASYFRLASFRDVPTVWEPCKAIVHRTEIWCSYIGWNHHRLWEKRNLLGQE